MVGTPPLLNKIFQKLSHLGWGIQNLLERGDKPEKGELIQKWRVGVATFYTTLQFSSITCTFSDLQSFELAMQYFHPCSHSSLVLKPVQISSPFWKSASLNICPYIVLNLNRSFKFCARLGFNVIWFVKCMKIRKLKIEIISIQHNSFIYSIHCPVSPLSYARSTKTICLKLSAYSFA